MPQKSVDAVMARLVSAYSESDNGSPVLCKFGLTVFSHDFGILGPWLTLLLQQYEKQIKWLLCCGRICHLVVQPPPNNHSVLLKIHGSMKTSNKIFFHTVTVCWEKLTTALEMLGEAESSITACIKSQRSIAESVATYRQHIDPLWKIIEDLEIALYNTLYSGQASTSNGKPANRKRKFEDWALWYCVVTAMLVFRTDYILYLNEKWISKEVLNLWLSNVYLPSSNLEIDVLLWTFIAILSWIRPVLKYILSDYS